MDKKEVVLFNHYKMLFEEDLFNEYDVLGFLIMLRPYLSKYKYLLEFANVIAHRKRDRGIAMGCITVVQNNSFELFAGTNHVVGFRGIRYEALENDIICAFREQTIKISKKIAKEIILCIFSLSQFVEYEKATIKGLMYLVQGKNNTLALCATEGKEDSYFVCFSCIEEIKHIKLLSGGLIREPVEAIRFDGKLILSLDGEAIGMIESD